MCSLTALPLTILSRILSFLCPPESHSAKQIVSCSKAAYSVKFRNPKVSLSLDCAQSLTVPLPEELLSPGLASPILADAAACLLGLRVVYLTAGNTADQLSRWVSAFAPYVMAVSTQDSLVGWREDHLSNGLCNAARNSLCSRSVQLLNVLSIDAVKLQVLDLTDLPFHLINSMQDDALAALCTALECNSATLRQLGLPVFSHTDTCDKALEMTTLKRLDVFSVRLWNSPSELASCNPEDAVPSDPLWRMITAVSGHADRSRDLTTLRELHLINVECLPYDQATKSEFVPGVFDAVESLKVNMRDSAGDYYTQNACFVSMFAKLERLFWNGAPPPFTLGFPSLMRKISTVQLCGSRWITSQEEPRSLHSDPILFCNCRRTASLVRKTNITAPISDFPALRLLVFLGNMEYLSLCISRKRTRGIGEILQVWEPIKGLELILPERRDQTLRWEDWRSLTKGIQTSHENFCEVAIIGTTRDALPITCVNDAVECFVEVVKGLGARARRISFRVIFEPKRQVKVMADMCRLLKTCLYHTPRLESLEVEFRLQKRSFRDEAGWETLGDRMLRLKNQLLREIPSLRMLFLTVSNGSTHKPD